MATAEAAREGADEATWAQAFARRERWAFDEAYRRFGSLLYSVALGVLHNAQDAEDCLHDVLVRVWKNSNSFTVERGSVRTFLVVCVRNEAISRTRAAARRERLSERLSRETNTVEELEIADFIDEERVRNALSQLPDEQRQAVMLAYFGGKTHVEIAEQLNEPLGTVKSRIALGLRKLGTMLNARKRT
ncbi:MAG TPA: sigma-70 family RNA polymerase sigma factor [Candidatus Baltobacteraceae bacterium]|nr:sigma-70 family RNA polymerase sigma factor [Candidatus Baltobacteraceae bacterium]